jgi:hypothetical protein
MTPEAPPVLAPTGPRPAPPSAPEPPARSPWPLVLRALATGLVVAGYLIYRKEILDLLGVALKAETARAFAITLLGVTLVAVWWPVVRADPRFHAPILITYILALADAGYGMLESHYSPWLARLTSDRITHYSPTYPTILATLAAELALGRFMTGRWPHLASAYISGISAGILVKSELLWPFLFCGLISITSKYVLRVGGRHLWNPTNLGMTAILWLAANSVSSLSVQSGNDLPSLLLIWALGSLILYRLKLLHIPLVFVACYVPLAFLRSFATRNPINLNRFELFGLPLVLPVTAEVAPVTWTMFQLFIFFMITDPKTVTRTRKRQCLVAALVAVTETALRVVFRDDIHTLYHALFIVGPIASLIEIRYGGKPKGAAAATGAGPAPAPSAGTAAPAGAAAVKPGPGLGVTA